MVKLVTLLEQHLEGEPPTVAIQATGLWEATLGLVKLQEFGLEICLPVKVCCYHGVHSIMVYALCRDSLPAKMVATLKVHK